MRTNEQIRSKFEQGGLCICEWARRNGFSPALVYQVLSGRRRALRGQSHKIAVALGLKKGHIIDYQDLSFGADALDPVDLAQPADLEPAGRDSPGADPRPKRRVQQSASSRGGGEL